MKKLTRLLFPVAVLVMLTFVWYMTSDLPNKKVDNEESDSEITPTISLATLAPQPEDYNTVPLSTSVSEPAEEVVLTIPEDAQKVEVLWVSDGDTYIVNLNGTETTVRLIGVDTPESVAPDEYLEKSGKKNTAEGKVASTHMKELLSEGTEIYIISGEEPIDPYGRTLVYAWFLDGTMIEDYLLINGYAQILEIEPNTRYADHFREVFKSVENAA